MKFVLDWKRILLCFLGVFGMGFFLSFLILCNLGTDPCTFMNRSLAAKIGISFGNMQLCINALMLIFVLIFKRSMLGFGTVFNMVLVGYYADFFDWLWSRSVPESAFTEPVSRWCIFIITLGCFIVSVAVYINSQLGVAPYDALPIIITEKLTNRFPGFPGFLIRILWDGMAILIGILTGGIPIVGIVLMALFLGPVISYVGKLFEKMSLFSNKKEQTEEKV